MKIDLNSRMVYSINGKVYRSWQDGYDVMHFVTNRRHTTVDGWIGADYDMIYEILDSIENGDDVQILDTCIDSYSMSKNGYFDDIEPSQAAKLMKLVDKAVQLKNARTLACIENLEKIKAYV